MIVFVYMLLFWMFPGDFLDDTAAMYAPLTSSFMTLCTDGEELPADS